MSSLEPWKRPELSATSRRALERIERERQRAIRAIDDFVDTEIARFDSRVAIHQAVADLPSDLPPSLRRLTGIMASGTDYIVTRL